jgi:hypothetical protein
MHETNKRLDVNKRRKIFVDRGEEELFFFKKKH